MQIMGPLQPSLPSPTAIPLDLKDWFFFLPFFSILMIARDLL
jgi:hypothetical protein